MRCARGSVDTDRDFFVHRTDTLVTRKGQHTLTSISVSHSCVVVPTSSSSSSTASARQHEGMRAGRCCRFRATLSSVVGERRRPASPQCTGRGGCGGATRLGEDDLAALGVEARRALVRVRVRLRLRVRVRVRVRVSRTGETTWHGMTCTPT